MIILNRAATGSGGGGGASRLRGVKTFGATRKTRRWRGWDGAVRGGLRASELQALGAPWSRAGGVGGTE